MARPGSDCGVHPAEAAHWIEYFKYQELSRGIVAVVGVVVVVREVEWATWPMRPAALAGSVRRSERVVAGIAALYDEFEKQYVSH